MNKTKNVTPFGNLFKSNRQTVRDLSSVVSTALSNLYWTSGSHGILPPVVAIPPVHLTPVEKTVVKTSMSRLLIEEHVTWSCLLIAVFQNEDEKNLVSCELLMEDINLVEMGSYFTQLCENAIERAIAVYREDNPHIHAGALTQYGYFLAPTDGYDFDAMEDQLMDSLHHDTFDQYRWEDRIKVTPKEFIDSLAEAKF